MNKAYVEIGEACDAIVAWINNGEYKQIMQACRGDTKEDGFRAACFIIPSILLLKCNVQYIDK